ncbi:MAG: hypothetical protein K0R49_790 [Burkholderiales bacterium]|jgi:hypothetical protein|nr:hypothetical protein [Burkholderiales bacterium]
MSKITAPKPRSKLIIHVTTNIIVGLIAISMALSIGMCGYHVFEHMSWVDSFVNAAMILSGMGPLGPLTTTAGKIFAGFYALFSGLVFIAVVALIFAPIMHKFFVKIHLESVSMLSENSK